MAAPYKENQGVWMGIVKLVWDLHVKCLIPFDSMCKKVGNGANTSFWLDFQCRDMFLVRLCVIKWKWCRYELLVRCLVFRACFHRLYAIAYNRDTSVSDYWNGSTWNIRWICIRNGGGLSTQLDQLMTLLDSIHLSYSSDSQRWYIGVDNVFVAKEASVHLDNYLLVSIGLVTRQN